MSTTIEQQPIQRTVGRRQPRDGRPLLPAEREAMARNATYQTRVPKGVFRYQSHDEMAADRLRWTVDLMVSLHERR